jgi:hypothetical protein
MIVPRSCSSAWRTLSPSRKVHLDVSSNFASGSALSVAKASPGA